jgi:Ca-activated chloride channel family protein
VTRGVLQAVEERRLLKLERYRRWAHGDGVLRDRAPRAAVDAPTVDPLEYQSPARASAGADNGELLTLKPRYKQPDGDQSSLIGFGLTDDGKAFEAADPDYRFAAAVAGFGMLLRESPHKGQADYAKVLTWPNASRGADEGGLRAEFVRLVELARSLPRK